MMHPAPPTDDASAAARPLRVLYIARAPFVSGAERALLSILRAMTRHQSHIVQPHIVLGCDTAVREHVETLGLPCTIIPLAKRSKMTPWRWWRSVRAVDQLVRRVKPDVIHANDVPSCQAASVIGRRHAVARVIHIRWTIDAPALAWWARHGCEQIICISRYIREQLGPVRGTMLADADVRILLDAVDWPDATAASDAPKASTSEDDRSGRPLRLAFAGQLIPSKGLDLVIEAFAAVVRRHSITQPPLRLMIAGEDTQTGGVYRAHLEALTRRLGVADHIDWLGFVDDVANLYRNVDAVVCPSREEPLGLVPLEAAQWARPAIASETGGLRETVTHQSTGLLAEPTVEGWTSALIEAITLGPAGLASLGRTARSRTIEHFHPREHAGALVEMYQRAVRRCARQHAPSLTVSQPAGGDRV